jgi:menaquinone-dependent protoporphyrinogen oxidase
MRLLIAYGTTDGMTARIAERVAATMRSAGAEVELLTTRKAPRDLDVDRFDAVLIGASLHAGGFQRSTRRFVRRHLDVLRRKPTGFFAVCLAIASSHPAEKEAAWSIARAFPAKLDWSPDLIEVIAGALMFSRYGFLRRFAMVRIARQELGAIDPSRDHVYTDWEAVDRFAVAFLARASTTGSTSAGASFSS